jgi:hypothetical protein
MKSQEQKISSISCWWPFRRCKCCTRRVNDRPFLYIFPPGVFNDMQKCPNCTRNISKDQHKLLVNVKVLFSIFIFSFENVYQRILANFSIRNEKSTNKRQRGYTTHKKRPQVKMGGVVRGAREQPAVPFIQQNTHNISLLYFEKKENRKTGWPRSNNTQQHSSSSSHLLYYFSFELYF